MRWERIGWLRLGAVAFDAVALSLLWVVAVYGRAGAEVWWSRLQTVDPAAHLPLLFLVVPVWLLVLYERGSYFALRRKRAFEVATETTVSVVLALMSLLAVLFLVKAEFASRTLVVGWAVASLPTLLASRQLHLSLLRHLRRGAFDPHRIVLVGEPDDARPFLRALERHEEWGIAVHAVVPDEEELAALLVDQPIDEVYLTRFDPERTEQIAQLCEEMGVQLSLDANFLGLSTARAELQSFDGWAVLTFSNSPSAALDLALKRVIDVGGALVGLLLLAPVLALVAAAIKLSDGGPVLFAQTRAGRYGSPFQLYKFRSMVPDAEAKLAALQGDNEMSGPVFKMADDPRITRLGRLLRRTSIDELPQLFNVLRGDMSLVGPRPHLPSEVAGYERWQLRRLSMRPGMTCIWQVSGRNTVDFDDWMELDLQYIDNWSLWLDLNLLVRTVPAVIRGRGAV